jgi:hypothetical protein
VVIPVAVVALRLLPEWAGWLFVVCFGITNLRFGAQLETAMLGRIALVTSIALALTAALRGWLNRGDAQPEA